MKLYRLHMTTENGMSIGYDFFTSKEAADKKRREHLQESGEDAEANTVDVLSFEPTRASILDLLKRVASHPDNG